MLNSENVIIVFLFTKHFIPLKNKKPKQKVPFKFLTYLKYGASGKQKTS